MELNKRCVTICGSNNGRCSLKDNSRHIACIADMVLNKVAPVKDLLEMAVEWNQCKRNTHLLSTAARSIDNVVEWVEYLKDRNRNKTGG